MASKRKALTKKLRFEVFKRDKFTCMYCGGKAPDVVLHVDHIVSVRDGGENDLLNLVTSCVDCNLGKGATPLPDDSAITKQREQLEFLAERREQLDLLRQWREELSKLDQERVAFVVGEIESKLNGLVLNDKGKSDVEKWLKRFSVKALLDAIERSASTYLPFDTNGYLSSIPRIAIYAEMPAEDQEYWKRANSLAKYAQIRFNDFYPANKARLRAALRSAVEDYDDTSLKKLIQQCESIHDFIDECMDLN